MSCIYKYENKDYTKEELIIELATNRIDVVNSKLGLNLETSSKVVDENGEPKIMYHATLSNKFFEFDPNRIGTQAGILFGRGFYFDVNKTSALFYTSGKDTRGKLMEVFLNSKNPMNYYSIPRNKDLQEDYGVSTREEFLTQQGKDGVYTTSNSEGEWDSKDQFIVFNSNQIKSAENTRAQIGQESNDIRYFKKPPTQKEIQTNIQTDSEYLLNDFVADFAAEKLKTPTEFNRQFKITETGIELASNDIITLETVKAYIQDGVKYSKEIADYSLLSKDMPNLKEKGSFTVESVLDKRIKAVNDINSVSKPTTEITIIDEESFSAPNETNQFLRVGNEIYEQQEQGYYNKLQKNINPNFFDLNPQQPEFKNFDIQQEESSENKAKKLTDKDTDNENFSCLS